MHGKINELQLDVHVRGLPTPSVTWVKDGVKVENSDKYQQVDHDDGTCELFISHPKASDSGKYVCQAENREGKTEIVHMITVEPRVRAPRISPPREGRPPRPTGDEEAAPAGEEGAEGEGGEGGEGGEKRRRKPKPDEEEQTSSRREVPPPPDLRKRLYFRNFLSNRTVKSGSNVKWMVNIDGPEPTAKWFFGDQPIAFGPRSKMSMQDGIAWLNLVGVTEEDAGEYTLRVRGSENEIVSTCNLFVYSTAKPEVISPTFVVGIKGRTLYVCGFLPTECVQVIVFVSMNICISICSPRYSLRKLTTYCTPSFAFCSTLSYVSWVLSLYLRPCSRCISFPGQPAHFGVQGVG